MVSFFRFTTDKDKRALVNEIIQSEEGIAMAGQVLLTISKDKVERARLESEYKYAMDLQSRMVNAERRGEENKAYRTAERLLKKGLDEADVADAVELPLDKVLEIKARISVLPG